MKVNKLLPIAAIFGCYVFGSAAIAQQVCPVGGGACLTRVVPASSYSSARAVDLTVRPVPGADMPAGGFCGWAAGCAPARAVARLGLKSPARPIISPFESTV